MSEKLEQEISKASRKVFADAYDMSIGELLNLYRDKELHIQPEFQRLFRWEIEQKSRLIESVLLGIPVPPVFVFELDDSRWELVDGLQRISTLLQFTGSLRDPDKPNQFVKPDPLVHGKYLSELEDIYWSPDVPGATLHTFSDSQRIRIKRARLGVQILRRQSDVESKFDLFQRLNSGGSKAERQELRNCMIVMKSPEFLNMLRELSNLDDFKKLVPLSESEFKKQKHIAYVNKFLVLSFYQFDRSYEIENYFDDYTEKMILDYSNDLGVLRDRFKAVFSLLRRASGEKVLHKPNLKGIPTTKPQNTTIETICVGISRNIDKILKLNNPESFVDERLKEIWKEEIMTKAVSTGVSGQKRLLQTVPFGQKWFTTK